MITKQKEFEIATNAFKLMTSTEQGLVLIFFRKSKIKHHLDAWIDSVHTVIQHANNKAANS